MPSYWCYQCEDFTPHQLLANSSSVCSVCGKERESALTRPRISGNLLDNPTNAAMLQPPTDDEEEDNFLTDLEDFAEGEQLL